MRRSFLVLQGTASPFFDRIATALRARGHNVRRANFCGGDWLYSGGRDDWNYSGKLSDLEGWYSTLAQQHDFTDVIMFGDCREVHRHAHPVAAAHGMRVHVFEEGYVRPYWITLERHGVNGRSLLPRDPSWYLDRRSTTAYSKPGRPTGYSLYERAMHDMRYRGANALYSRRFPHYVSHRPRNGFMEYSGLAVRSLLQRRHRKDAENVTRELLRSDEPYYLFPLQLSSDAQIVFHSPFDDVRGAIDKVLQSFARHAPRNSLLVIKNHPLDTGLIDYHHYAFKVAAEVGVADRLRFIDAGHLPTLLEHAKSVVVVNSTVGLSALYHRRPLIALGKAVYSMAGLTWQGELDDFWREVEPPDMHLYWAFHDYLIQHTQINGDFYTRSGIKMAVAGAVTRLESVNG
ncbi:capsule biosynthesis protein [Burkholderia metallica]|uniref:capsule biosynthesis protein n=1 Tax=Burkholderia metallica TaxID=488729 RepID=UPI001CF2EAA9|nr:capsular biosynthesis protein [Burkholderia metallica]MCA7998066.1 capsular biosynthesis protein [Burkholderia metallica]